MRIAFTTTFAARDIHNWSGTPYHMSQAFIKEGEQVDYIGELKRQLPPFFKLKQTWNKYITNQRESPRFNVVAAKHYSAQVAAQLKKLSADVVISPLINPIAYLDCTQPIVLWTDAVYAALVGFYPAFAYHSAHTIAQGNAITAACLARCRLAIFSSDWAARSAAELYGINRDKIKVVPYGANLAAAPAIEEVKYNIQNRAPDKIKLLFLAKSWERKGGDIALAVVKALHEAGHSVELTIVGYTPTWENDAPPAYVNCLGFISKQTPEGKTKITHLLSQSHFLILPSRADACPMVFAEANAYGLPCLTSYVGGIATAVKDNVNGMTFALDAPVNLYCDYIVKTLQARAQYETLALSAQNEYATRLNWQAAVSAVKNLIG